MNQAVSKSQFLSRYISEDVYIIKGTPIKINSVDDIKIPITSNCPDCQNIITESSIPYVHECLHCGSLFEETDENGYAFIKN